MNDLFFLGLTVLVILLSLGFIGVLEGLREEKL
jgi:hypothetical protein